MKSNLVITIATKREILTLAYEELSGIAQRAYAEDGTSLYDGIVPHSGDVARMCLMVDEATGLLMERLRLVLDSYDVKPNAAFFAPAEEGDEVRGDLHRIFVSTPDLPGDGTVAMDVRRYLVLYLVAQFTRERYKTVAEEYGKMCASQLTLAVGGLLRRKTPIRRC